MPPRSYPRLLPLQVGRIFDSTPPSPETTALRSPVPHLLQSNEPPSENERLRIEGVLEDVQEEAALLYTQFEHDSESSANSTIHATLEGMVSFTYTHESVLSALRILPDEILLEIFLSCLPCLDLEPWHCRTWKDIPSFRLSQVCRRWRVLAINTPALWSVMGNIIINEKTAKKGRNSYSNFIEELLRRSRNAGLWIYMTFPNKDYGSGEHPVIDILIKNEAQWVAFGISSGPEALKSISEPRRVVFPIRPHLSLLRLRKLTLDIHKFTEPAISIVGFAKAPALTEVNVSQVPPGLLLLPFKRLLMYGESDPRQEYPLASVGSIIVQILKRSQNLVKLLTFCLHFISEQEPTGKDLVLKNLKILILEPNFICYGIERAKSLLVLPVLEELRVKGQHHNLTPLVISLVRRSVPPNITSSLQKLHLRHFAFYRGDLLRLLKLTPNLKELIMDFPPESDLRQIYVAFKDARDNQCSRELVPRLQILVLHVSLDILVAKRHLISNLARVMVWKIGTSKIIKDGQKDTSVQHFRLVLPGSKSVWEAQTLLNQWNDKTSWSARPLINPMIPLCERLNEVLTELKDEATTKWKWLFNPKFPHSLDKLIRDIEGVRLDTSQALNNLYVSRLHLSLSDLSNLREGYIPQDNKYKFRIRTASILKIWDSAILADLQVRNIQWALKGYRSLIYLNKDDELHTSSYITDSIYFGLQDDYSDHFMWPDPVNMNEFSC
ncbi:hypothetical protein CPB84DRAFT_1767858 [Gymnopilus junonius]|uniref:F-box domain-containing protein n=1 Tax=Gymnopilus junonius TaxID=109634 RepID=A0A9P5NTA3_GYMJU|nr:hypothetical protein CPB84DRAFT_1767858 [Gymnopilus junonius]